MQLMGGVILGDHENGIPVVVRRAEDASTVALPLKPEQEPGERAMIGVRVPLSVTISRFIGEIKDSAVTKAKLISPPAEGLQQEERKFQAGDEVVRVGDSPVRSYRQFAAALAGQPAKPLLITVDRPLEEQGAAQRVPGGERGDGSPKPSQELTFELPAQHLQDFGLSMKMGPIVAIQDGSPAEAAGLAVGDVIESVDGHVAGADEQGNVAWTPVRLPDYLREAAGDGRDVEITVSRTSKAGDDAGRASLRVTPRVPEMFYSVVPPGAPQGSEAIGIAYRIENEIQSVLPNGPAAKGGLGAGDKITAARLIYANDKDGTPDPIKLGPDDLNWPFLVSAIQHAPAETIVELTVIKNGKPDGTQVLIKPASVEDRYVPARGFSFEPVERIRTADSLMEQMRYGWDETVDALTMVFRFLQKLGTQVPITMLGGPGTIAVAAGGAASQGLSTLLVFLTMLSANLAVINFLPIPLLDGGHMVFLAYEGLRGRPANEKVVLVLHMAGFAFIITLMLFVIGLDIQRWLFT
jgi:regulator of sigma E protease